ncbi:gluconate transporter [Lacibacter luteus]|uniref:Gluconate transporter n=1 Tax=Lacibacter luteus TaxID=2508719 RepID=A0A4Q1CMB6_9BACT|nr:gluconate:H+ symporter [Lacibacter luteus]RXK61759.1 gluconate transporter [Lacibacter luteus]
MTFLIIILAIALQVFLTVKKVSPFLSLLIVAIVAGLALGMPAADLLKSIEKGVGSTLGGLALILCLGAVLGKILEASGAAEKIAITLIKRFGEKNIQWAVLLTGFLIGIPLYYNAGFVILVPLVFMLAKKTGLPLLYIAIPMAASLSTMHCFLPPHPGPVVLVNAFKADMGKVLIYGILIAIPAVIVAGPLLGRMVKGITSSQSNLFSPVETELKELPAAAPSFFVALLPVLLITLAVIAHNFLAEGILKTILLFIGDSTIALLIAVLLAFYLFGICRNIAVDKLMKWLSDGISGIAMILLIITAGGVFKQVLQDSGTGAYIASFSSKWQMPPLIFAWVVTALLRVTIGSATVAGITAAGIVAPLVTSGAASPELMVLAVGSGSVFGSHINDSGFWMYKEFFKLSLKQTFLSWTVMETVISILGLAGVLVIHSLQS